jgi:hypothetical protein
LLRPNPTLAGTASDGKSIASHDLYPIQPRRTGGPGSHLVEGDVVISGTELTSYFNQQIAASAEPGDFLLLGIGSETVLTPDSFYYVSANSHLQRRASALDRHLALVDRALFLILRWSEAQTVMQ